MGRQEFIDGLRRALAGRVEPEVIEDAVRYYEDYMDIQLRQGKSLDEVLQDLGRPALIAKSIVSANQSGRGDDTQAGSIYEEGVDFDEDSPRSSRSRLGERGVRLIMRMPGWLTILLAAVVLLLVLWVILSILSVLAPVILVLLIPFVLMLLIRRAQGRR